MSRLSRTRAMRLIGYDPDLSLPDLSLPDLSLDEK
jgi:hypothetical protein